MSDTVNIKARKSFQGVEGMWRKGQERPVEKGRAHSLIAKGLAEEVTDGAVRAHNTKPAPAPTHRPAAPPKTPGGRAPTHRPAPPLKTKGQGKGKGGAKPPAPAPGSEGAQTPDDLITVEGTVITVHAHTNGEGDAAFKVEKAELTGEADQVYSVFVFRDGSPASAANGEEAVKALADSPNAVLLDVVRIPAAPGNE